MCPTTSGRYVCGYMLFPSHLFFFTHPSVSYIVVRDLSSVAITGLVFNLGFYCICKIDYMNAVHVCMYSGK